MSALLSLLLLLLPLLHTAALRLSRPLHLGGGRLRKAPRAPRVRFAAAASASAGGDEEGLADLGSLAPVGELLKPLDPQLVSVVEQDPSVFTLPATQAGGGDRFVELFRSCAPYIKMHQGRTIVLHISSLVLEHSSLFEETMVDLSILSLLGVRVVLVVGMHGQVDDAVRAAGAEPQIVGGRRVSDANTLRAVQQVSGEVRARVEAALARGRHAPPGGSERGASSAPRLGAGVDVVTSNALYSAQPVGVLSGVDFKSTGEVRRVDADKIHAYLDGGAVVLLTSLGYSASGEVYNVPAVEVAARAAGALKASKLIYLTGARLVMHSQLGGAGASAVPVDQRPLVQSMRLAEARELVRHWDARSEVAAARLPEAADPAARSRYESAEFVVGGLCKRCVEALSSGVNRAHLVPPAPGALLQELYTLDGAGTLIAYDVYDGIRIATAADVPGIAELTAPLEEQGVLIPRPLHELTRDVHQGFYYVLTRDANILACAMLKRYALDCAELGCLVVSPRYRKEGRGDSMLSFLERTAISAGVSRLFALSTRTMQWFTERGFVEVPVSELPERRQRTINLARGSKVFMKGLNSPRELDAEELFWAADAPQSRQARGG